MPPGIYYSNYTDIIQLMMLAFFLDRPYREKDLDVLLLYIRGYLEIEEEQDMGRLKQDILAERELLLNDDIDDVLSNFFDEYETVDHRTGLLLMLRDIKYLDFQNTPKLDKLISTFIHKYAINLGDVRQREKREATLDTLLDKMLLESGRGEAISGDLTIWLLDKLKITSFVEILCMKAFPDDLGIGYDDLLDLYISGFIENFEKQLARDQMKAYIKSEAYHEGLLEAADDDEIKGE